MAAYYNEWEPYAAQWLRNLIAAGHIAPGDVDERSILDVCSDDLRGYDQCHFFAGLGGWSRALRLAGWDDTRPVWTGSCPCQPFSTAGNGKKQSDERHLWPHWARLIGESKPTTIFGEQVASAIAAGWLDDVCHDLEKEGYACASAVLPACSVGAPHKRDRLWFVALAAGGDDRRITGEFRKEDGRQEQHLFSQLGSTGEIPAILANSESNHEGRLPGGAEAQQSRPECDSEIISNTPSLGSPGSRESEQSECSETQEDRETTFTEPSCGFGFWATEPNVGRVANGVPARVGRLRALGNAIVPQVAAEFIKATM